MERQFDFNLDQRYSRCNGWDHFSESQQHMWFWQFQYPDYICFLRTLTTRGYKRSRFGMRGLFQYLQYFTGIGVKLLYLDTAVGMEREFNFNFHQRYSRCIRWDHFSQGQQLMRFQQYPYPECIGNGTA